MAEEQTPQPVVPQPVAPQPAQPAAPTAPQAPAAPAKKSNIWLWLIGGCLTILILIGIAILGFGWWAAHKVKKAIKENQPRLEQMQKDAEQWSKDAEELGKTAEEWQAQMEELQKNMPNPDDFQMPDDVR